MLHFLYTGEIHEVNTRPTELLHLSTFYRLPDLEMACKEELVRYFFRLHLSVFSCVGTTRPHYC